MSGKLNVVAEQGATWDRVITLSDAAGNPIDLTDYVARMQVRKTFEDTTTLLSLTTGAGITLGGVAGTIHIVMSWEQMAAMPPGRWLYDLEIELAGVVTRVLEGRFVVTPEVTR